MPEQTIEENLRKLARVNVRRLKGSRNLATEALIDHMEVIELIKEKDWKELSKQGTRQVDLSRRYWQTLLKNRRKVNDHMALARTTDRRISKESKQIVADLSKPETLEQFREFFIEEALPPNTIEELLKRLKEDASTDATTHSSIERLKRTGQNINNRVTYLSRLALLGIECRWVSRFNQLARGRGPREPVADQFSRLKDMLNNQEGLIKNCDHKTYTLLKSGKWQKLAEHTAATITRALNLRSPDQILIDTAIALQKLRNRTLENGEEQLLAAQLASRCGGLIRRQLLSYAIGFRMAYIAITGSNSPRGRAEKKRAVEDPFESLTPQGRSVLIKDLLTDPEAYDGKMVTVLGEVQNLNIKVLRGKATSRFQLVDPLSNKSVNVFVPYIQIDSTGLVNGCAVRLVGPWLKYDRESRQENTLHIDRISFTKQGRKSWLDYQTSKISDFLYYLPHNLNMEWSWQAGLPGAVNQLFYSNLWLKNFKGD